MGFQWRHYMIFIQMWMVIDDFTYIIKYLSICCPFQWNASAHRQTMINQYLNTCSIKGTTLLSEGECASAAAYLFKNIFNPVVISFYTRLKAGFENILLNVTMNVYICQMGWSLPGAALSGVRFQFCTRSLCAGVCVKHCCLTALSKCEHFIYLFISKLSLYESHAWCMAFVSKGQLLWCWCDISIRA